MAGTWEFYEALNRFFGTGDPGGAGVHGAEIELSLEEACTGGRCRVILDTPFGTRGYDVIIPPGVTDGQHLRLIGSGLDLVVRLAPDARYRIDGRDVTVDLPVTPWEAAMGAAVSVGTPNGPVRIQVPPGSSSGRRIRLPGRGLPNPQGTPGDLYAEIRIAVPRNLTVAERELFIQLSQRSTFDPRTPPDGD